MSLQELGTVKQEKAAVKFVLLNNSRLGMVHEIQSIRYKRYSQVFLEENPDFEKLAEAYRVWLQQNPTAMTRSQQPSRSCSTPRGLICSNADRST